MNPTLKIKPISKDPETVAVEQSFHSLKASNLPALKKLIQWEAKFKNHCKSMTSGFQDTITLSYF